MTKEPALSPADRQRASRERRRAAGVPLHSALDRAVSRLLLAKLARGEFEIDGLELLAQASNQLVAGGHATVLGARQAVLSLTARAEG